MKRNLHSIIKKAELIAKRNVDVEDIVCKYGAL